jgi:hypothetical protein
MEDEKMVFPTSGVVYSSGLFIHDESLISTLSVLYERVYLPSLLGEYPADPDTDERHDASEIECRPDLLEVDDIEAEFGQPEMRALLENHPYLVEFYNAANAWKSAHSLLFSESVLVRLPSYEEHLFGRLGENEYDDPSWGLFEAVLEKFIRTKTKKIARHASTLEKAEVAFVIDLTSHALREDVHLPRIFDQSQLPNRSALVALEATTAFQYLVPKLNRLKTDEILELRRKVKDTREGFTMHLQKLSKGLDGMLKAGEKPEDLKGYAQNIVETDLIPDYKEFRRQLEAEQAGKIKKVLDVSGKLMEIDAAPWTPKFWGMLLKALGMSAIETAANQKERLTNRYQAYEFMKEVEDMGQRKRKS